MPSEGTATDPFGSVAGPFESLSRLTNVKVAGLTKCALTRSCEFSSRERRFNPCAGTAHQRHNVIGLQMVSLRGNSNFLANRLCAQTAKRFPDCLMQKQQKKQRVTNSENRVRTNVEGTCRVCVCDCVRCLVAFAHPISSIKRRRGRLARRGRRSAFGRGAASSSCRSVLTRPLPYDGRSRADWRRTSRAGSGTLRRLSR